MNHSVVLRNTMAAGAVALALVTSGCQTLPAISGDNSSSADSQAPQQAPQKNTAVVAKVDESRSSEKAVADSRYLKSEDIDRDYDYKIMGGVPSAAIRLFEKHLTYETSSYDAHRGYCGKWLQIGNFGKAKECIEILDKQVEAGRVRGDFEQPSFLLSVVGGPLVENQNHDYEFERALTDAYIARLHYALGDYEKAVEVMRKRNEVMRHYKPAPMAGPLGVFPADNELVAMAQIRHLGAEKAKPQALKVIEEIKKYEAPTFLGMELMDPKKMVNESMIRIYFALEDYETARVILDDTPDKIDMSNSENLSHGLMAAHALLDPVGGTIMLIAGLVAEEVVEKQMEEELAAFEMSDKMSKLFLQSKIYYETGENQLAINGYDAFLAWKDNDWLHELKYTVLHDRGMLAARQGDRKAAAEYLKRAIETIEKDRATIDTESGKIGFVGDKQEVYGDLIAILVADGKHAEAFEYSERAKSRALVDMLAAKTDFRIDGGKNSAGIQQALESAPTQVAWVKSELGGDNRRRSADDSQLQVVQKAAPELASLVSVEIPSSRELKGLVPKGETLLEYFANDDKVFAFIVTRNSITASAIDVENLGAKISQYRSALDNPDSDSYRAIGEELSSQLLRPLVKKIKTKRLTVVPHGSLHYLPFAALPVERGYLVDRFSLRVLPSVSVLKYLKNRKNSGGLLALGNPDLKNAEWNLPGTEREVKTIAKVRKGSAVFMREQATETLVKAEGDKYSMLHIASHGIFDAERPLESRLLLATDSQNDGMLTVGELYSMELNANLVTLSACETGLGRINNGDDVVGLTRGFLYAGASSVVASLWQVDDDATAQLMQSFYRHLKKHDKRTALQLAQLETKKKYNSHPYFWAPFQLSGAVH